MPPTFREAAEEIMLAAKGSAEFCNKTLDEYINGPGWTNPHWEAGFNMLREAIAAYDMKRADGLITYNRVYEGRPPRTALPQLRWTERRDPCSADASGEWTDFD